MEQPLLTISEAAKTFGCSPKTIQRNLARGALRWQGAKPPARGVRGIQLAEAQAALIDGNSTGYRRRNAPAIGRVERFLRAIKNGNGAYEPKKVLGVYLSAAVHGVDVDFLLYCIQRLREEDEAFVRMLMGEKPLVGADPLRIYAARKLVRLGREDYSFKFHNANFAMLWRALAKTWSQAEVDVEPVVVYDTALDRASMALVPRWVDGAPSGTLQDLGGRISIIRRPRIEQSPLAHSAALKISRALFAEQTMKGKTGTLGLKYGGLLSLAGDKDNISFRMDKLLSMRVGDLTARQRGKISILEMFYKDFKLTAQEGQAFIRAFARISPSALGKQTFQYNDALRYRTGEVRKGHKIGCLAVAKAFGVTRQTAAAWLKAKSPAGARKRRTQPDVIFISL